MSPVFCCWYNNKLNFSNGCSCSCFFLYSAQIVIIKLIDLSFNVNKNINSAEEAIQRFRPSLGYIDIIKEYLEIIFIAFINKNEEALIDNVRFSFFKGHKGYWFIPFRMLRYVKKERPDVVFVQGLNHSFQVICMRLFLGKDAVIVVQHHGEQPLPGVKKILQKIADKCITAYFFTSADNAQQWIDAKMISTKKKCFEVLEASAHLTKRNKNESKNVLGMSGNANFLWVGRLNANKDPFTVLYGFEKYLRKNRGAKFYMIYQEDELLQDIKTIISKSEVLANSTFLAGKMDHENLATWYSAADFYISGSHREGSGYALLEAMACGCIPVVTDIPSYRAITSNGGYGILYEKNNVDSLLQALDKTETINRSEFSKAVEAHFNKNLSFEKIATDIFTICKKLMT